MMKNSLKTIIIEAVRRDRELYKSDVKHARVLGISVSQYSRFVNKGELEGVLSDGALTSIARIVRVQLNENAPWVVVKTKTFNYITTQLETCQKKSICRIFCDYAGIGKTVAGKNYAENNKNAVYIDCSQVKSKQKLLRKIAREFGVVHTGRYADVYDDLVFLLRTAELPLIILDEAGDLDYTAFLELKALENATTHLCGWYMMGADGLEQKMTRQKDLKKVGFAEIFDRYGNAYKKVTPIGESDLKQFHINQIALVAKANGATITPLQMYAKTKGSLRAVRVEILKHEVK
ncbi:ATP-binding protein [Tenacibaculum finnmarkense]|nr:ATP-binding protein [Tenacibaculum finnmarkense]